MHCAGVILGLTRISLNLVGSGRRVGAATAVAVERCNAIRRALHSERACARDGADHVSVHCSRGARRLPGGATAELTVYRGYGALCTRCPSHMSARCTRKQCTPVLSSTQMRTPASAMFRSMLSV